MVETWSFPDPPQIDYQRIPIMFDFNDVHMSTKDEQIRAFAVESALQFSEASDSAENVVARAKMIEDYITHGATSTIISNAVKEGLREGRYEVREAVERTFPHINLDYIFKSEGWNAPIPEKPEPENDRLQETLRNEDTLRRASELSKGPRRSLPFLRSKTDPNKSN